MVARRWSEAEPEGGHGAEGDHALTIKPDHSVGADQIRLAHVVPARCTVKAVVRAQGEVDLGG
jgi:hypothetical protein